MKKTVRSSRKSSTPPSRNTGKQSEVLFENVFTKVYGIRAYVQHFFDAAHIHGMNRGPVKVPEQPADRLVVVNGDMFYAEIKSVSNGTSFPFSMIAVGQMKAAKLTVLAGGKYIFFVHNLKTDTFHIVPANTILDSIESGKMSLKWTEMPIWQDYETYKGQ